MQVFEAAAPGPLFENKRRMNNLVPRQLNDKITQEKF
jgi:hypothetical protein